MIFVDTSFWVALRNRRDSHHEEAVGLLKRYADSDQSERIEILPVTDDLEEEALGWLRRRDEREYSFVDSTSFALMRSREILEALAFDGDFAAAGFIELRLTG